MEDEMSKTLVIPNDVFFGHVMESLAAGKHVVFTVKGWSMYPFFRNGKDRVCVASQQGRDLKPGDVILFRFRGNFILHRICGLREADDGTVCYLTIGDGNVRGMEMATPDSVSGVAVRRITPSGREWNCDSRSWKLASFVWMKLLCVRRWCLAVLRRIYR